MAPTLRVASIRSFLPGLNGIAVPVHFISRLRPPVDMSSSFGPKKYRRGRHGRVAMRTNGSAQLWWLKHSSAGPAGSRSRPSTRTRNRARTASQANAIASAVADPPGGAGHRPVRSAGRSRTAGRLTLGPWSAIGRAGRPSAVEVEPVDPVEHGRGGLPRSGRRRDRLVRDEHHGHPGGPTGQDAVERVLDDQAVGRRDPEPGAASR